MAHETDDRSDRDRDRPPTDLVVVIALEEELEQLLVRLPHPPIHERDPIHGGYHYRVDLGPAEAPYRCVIALIGAMGPDRAGVVADRLLAAYAPAAIASVGLAAGIHRDVRLGTVVVAAQVDAYLAETKAVPDGPGAWQFQHRGRVFACDHALVQEVVHLRSAHRPVLARWAQACRDDRDRALGAEAQAALAAAGLLDGEPTVVCGHLASGPVVGAAGAFSAWLHRRDAGIQALEMESAGLVEAAATRARPVPTLVIRGISDLGDERKTALDAIGGGGLRRLAMGNATRLLLALLDAGLLPRSARPVPAAGQAAPRSLDRQPDGAIRVAVTAGGDATTTTIGHLDAAGGTVTFHLGRP